MKAEINELLKQWRNKVDDYNKRRELAKSIPERLELFVQQNAIKECIDELEEVLITTATLQQREGERYDATMFTPPFRIGRKQKRAILDTNGKEVILMPHNSEKQAQMYCDYLNGQQRDVPSDDIYTEFQIKKAMRIANNQPKGKLNETNICNILKHIKTELTQLKDK